MGAAYFSLGRTQLEVFFSSDYLRVMGTFLCVIIICKFDLIVSL